MIKSTPISLAEKKVLVLDEDQGRLSRIKHFLEKHQAVFYSASSVQSMVEKVSFFRPNLCLVSLDLKGTEAMALHEILDANPTVAKTPIIYQGDAQTLLKAYVKSEAHSKGLYFDFISWPYVEEEIQLRLTMALADQVREEGDDEPEDFPCAINEDTSRFDKVIFNAAHKIVRSNLSKTPNLTELAKLVGTNTKRLSQTFSRVCNMTVYQYIIELKMVAAVKLLQETDLEIRYIAMDLGYSSQANFSTAFKAKYGAAPRDFRKQ